jgi:hypothetical protein
MGQFESLSKERVSEIRKALERATRADQDLVMTGTGEVVADQGVRTTPEDRRNALGRFGTHYAG